MDDAYLEDVLAILSQTHTIGASIRDGEIVEWSGDIPQPTIEELENMLPQVLQYRLQVKKAEKLAEIANRRWVEETKGISLPNGAAVKTDRESQALLTGASVKAIQDPTYTCKWKGSSGWVVLDAPTILMITEFVRQHVQQCFDREYELGVQIETIMNDPFLTDQQKIDAIDAVTWESE